MFTAQIWTLLPFPEYPSSARHPFFEVVPVELPVPELGGQPVHAVAVFVPVLYSSTGQSAHASQGQIL